MSFAQPNKLQGPEVIKAEEVVKPSVCELIALARRIGEVRNARKEILPAGQFGEPGWDMMLALYLASIRGEFLTVTNVCDASDAPPTTEEIRLRLRSPDLSRSKPMAAEASRSVPPTLSTLEPVWSTT